jgi:hypothetical protein
MRLDWAMLALLLLAGCSSEPLGGNSGLDMPPMSAEPETLRVLDARVVSSDPDAENFQQVSAEVDFGKAQVASAALRVTLESPCFPFSGWLEQGVPEGQNWPARCHAFDRALSVTLDDAGPDHPGPGLELLRAITPFGGPIELVADITDVVNGMPGAHELRLTIDTFSDAAGLVSGSAGEWIASVSVVLQPGTPPREVVAVRPLLLEAQTSVEAEPLVFTVPEGVESARIDYRATGHGGAGDPQCIGPAEEFCRRQHLLLLDGEPIADLLPWRSDCATLCTMVDNDDAAGPASYCAENPCGDPRSVRASRANWCPGSATPPFELTSPVLTEPGTHELMRTIEGLREGGQWRVSATYFALAAPP